MSLHRALEEGNGVFKARVKKSGRKGRGEGFGFEVFGIGVLDWSFAGQSSSVTKRTCGLRGTGGGTEDGLFLN